MDQKLYQYLQKFDCTKLKEDLREIECLIWTEHEKIGETRITKKHFKLMERQERPRAKWIE